MKRKKFRRGDFLLPNHPNSTNSGIPHSAARVMVLFTCTCAVVVSAIIETAALVELPVTVTGLGVTVHVR
jgi:hypothetical protein